MIFCPVLCPAMSTEPRLPQDVERTIFELAAYKDPGTALRIILVAHRCRCWIEPVLYRSVVVRQASWTFNLFLQAIESRPAHFARWIKEIRIDPYIMPNDPAVNRILAICTGVVHLVDLSYGKTPFAILSQLRLKTMCISLDIVDDLGDDSYFQHPAFAQLTHLHVLDAPHRWSRIPFSDLPALTHLALQNYKTQIRPAYIPVLNKILADCPKLEVLVVLVPFFRQDDKNLHTTMLRIDDRRLSILPWTWNHVQDDWMFPQESNKSDDSNVSQELCNFSTAKNPRTRRRKRQAVCPTPKN
ncbi:Zn(2)-C6 fungal-type domain-containing protein [Favolaschia claudopus]|uniref:Zn(2)-C6 fungal-type domain-containing protein n=1 Tax=Favolaschia claudopus TaxID=2862362 RepID=A0AAW0EL27_9AGAR